MLTLNPVPEEAAVAGATRRNGEAKQETISHRNEGPTRLPTNLSSLPAEVRLAVWTACVPRRVIGLRPYSSQGAATGEAHVLATSGRGMPMPVAAVCYESRSVVTHRGLWVMGADGRRVWYGAQHDTVLLNSHDVQDYVLPDEDRAPPTRLASLLDEAVRRGGRIAVRYTTLRSYLGTALFELLAQCAVPSPPSGPQPTLLVFFDEIVVTGTRAQAAASGLFGGAITLEEKMLIVPLSDRETLRRIQAKCKARPRANGGGGSLSFGNAGFLRELLRPSHAVQNLRMLAVRFLSIKHHWHVSLEGEPTDRLVARAIGYGMPLLEQAVLFRFEETSEDQSQRP